MDHAIFVERTNHCRPCEFWRGACTRGHALTGDAGCPLQKFPGINGAGHQPDVSPAPTLPSTSAGSCCGGRPAELRPVTWSQVWQQLVAAEKRWRDAGHPLAGPAEYARRTGLCKGCEHYQWFQCRQCMCVVPVKAKVQTETCPAGKW